MGQVANCIFYKDPTAETIRGEEKGSEDPLPICQMEKKNPTKFSQWRGHTVVFPPHPPGIAVEISAYVVTLALLGDPWGAWGKHRGVAGPLE